MKNISKHFLPFFAAGGILLFALDSQTAISSAKDAVVLCGQAIIPSLFPMFFLCILLTGNMHGNGLRPFNTLGKFFGLQAFSSPLLLTCFLGGYPAGAQSVAQIYQNGKLSKNRAASILACCNQAGPAFIFGILGSQFESKFATWALWAVQIISAILLWLFQRSSENYTPEQLSKRQVSPTVALGAAISAIARVCGWVILFRCLIGYMNKLSFVYLDRKIQILLYGLLELTNGCLLISHIENESIRFVLCSVLLTFGGVCVTFQTKSVIADLPIMPYISKKILQALISFVLAAVVSAMVYHSNFSIKLWISVLACLCMICVYTLKKKKTVAFTGKRVYNNAV